MKRNFLLMLLATLLPLAGWAANYNWVQVTWSPTSTSATFTGGTMALPVPTVTYRTSQYGSTHTLSSSNYTVTWQYNGSSTVTVGEHAGTYTATITHTGDNWFTGNGSGTVTTTRTYTISRAANTITAPSFPDGSSWKYGETPNAPSSTTTDGVATYQYSLNGTSGWTAWPIPTDAMPGTYYVRAHVAQTVDYNEATSATSTFTIEKAPVTVTIGAVTKEWEWNSGSWVNPTMNEIAPTVSGSGQTWDMIKSNFNWNQLDPVSNIGPYSYTLDVTGTSDKFEYIVTGTGTLNVEKNTKASVGGGGNGAGLVYDGTPQALEPATPCAYRDEHNNEAGTVQYRITSPAGYETDWSDDIPTGTDANTYTIAFRGVGDVNHTDYEDLSDFYTVLIDKATPATIAVTSVGGASSSPEFTYDAPDFDTANFTYTQDTDGTPDSYTFTKDGSPAPWDGSAGDWTVAVTFAETNNWYSGTTAPFAFTVGKAEAEFTTAPVLTTSTLTYDETAQSLLENFAAVATNGDGTVQYKVDFTPNVGTAVTGSWDAAEPKGTGAGVYTISYRATEGDNYQAVAEVELGTVTIEKSPVLHSGGPAVVTSTLEFDGTEQKLLQTGKYFTGVKGGTVTYYAKGTTDTDAIAYTKYSDVVGKNAGDYTVSYKFFADDSGNYKDDDAETEVGTVTIDQFTLYVGGNEVTGTIEDVVNLETNTPKITMADFLPVDKVKDQFPAADTDGKANADAILNQLVAPAGDINTIIANAQIGTNPIALQKVDVAPAEGAPMNYKIDEATLLSNSASLTLSAIEAAIQSAPVGYTALEYNGDDLELVETPAVGYKAMAGTGSVAIGKVVYSLEETGTYTDDLTTIVGKDADTYTVYYKVELDESKDATNLDRFYEYTDGVKSIDVTIAQKPLTDEMFVLAATTAVYDGTDLTPAVTTKDGEPIVDADYTVAKTNSAAEDVTEMVNVDTYTFTFTAAADGNYSGSATATFEITKKALADEMFILSDDVEYTGAAQQPTITTKDGEPIVAADYTVEVKDGEGNPVAIDNLVAAGTYTFNFIATADGNYEGSASAEWTITKKALDPSFFVLNEAGPVTFDGTDQIPGFELLSTEPITSADFTFATTNSAAEAVTEMIDADTYTYTFTAAADGNYSGEATVNFVINQATATIVKPTKINLTYNGKNQILVTEATSDAVAGSEGQAGAKIEYKVTFGEDVIETEDITEVVGKNAGAYTVEYSITASDKNYTNPNITGTVEGTEIQRATIGYMLGGMTKVWDGKKISEEANKEDLEKVFTLYAGELFEEDVYDVPFTLSLPGDYRDAGEYTFSAAEAQEGVEFKEGYPVNYKINFTGTGNVVIKKADLVEGTDYTVPTAVAADLTYNREPQALVEAGEVLTATATDYPNTEIAGKPFGTMLYADAEAGEYAEEAAKKTDAGDYEIWWYVKGDINHNDTKKVKIEKSIAPKAMTFALQFETAEVKFDGTNKMPADTKAYDGEAALTDADYDLAITDDATELINAGAYTFTYTGKGNYEGSSATATITIGKAPLEGGMFALTAESATYNAKDQKPELKTTLGVAITDADYEVAADDEMINAGTYTFTITATEEGNFTGDKITKEFVIAKKEAIAIAADATKVYDGTDAFEDLPVLTFKNVEVTDDPAEVFTFGADAFVFTDLTANARTYAFTVDVEKIVADNYYVSEANGAKFTITPAPLMVNWNTEADAFTKVYGAEDPELTATTANLDITGAVAGEEDAIAAGTAITRAEGEAVGKYAITLAADPNAEVFANYNAQFEGYAEGFVITPATVKVSIASLEKVYDGEAATIDVKAEDLIVTGLKNGDKKEDIFTTLPTATVGSGEEENVGTYEVTLDGAVAADYEVEYMTSSFTITPAKITAATIAKQQIQKGQDVEENIDATAFTIEGVIAKDADKFFVTVNYAYQDMDGKVTAEAKDKPYDDGLIIDVDDEVKDNYEGYDAFFGDLLVLPADATVIADNADWTTEGMHADAVTFADRAINAGNWNVVALPFAATVKQISDAFGYAAVDVLNETASDGSIHFQVISSGTVPAYTPFIVKTTEDPGLVKDNFNQVVFFNVDIEAWPTAKNSDIAKDAANNIFWGTFMANTEIPAGSKAHWYMSKGTWYDTSARTKPVNLKAFRAYVEFYPANVAAGARIYIEEPDGTETAIDAIEFNKMINGENTYTVDGKKVSNTAQKGVYIQNGKKIAVK